MKTASLQITDKPTNQRSYHILANFLLETWSPMLAVFTPGTCAKGVINKYRVDALGDDETRWEEAFHSEYKHKTRAYAY